MERKEYIDALKAMKVMETNKRSKFPYVDFSMYSPCYKFSNENLSGYYPMFNIMGGDVLTVCGSGDQVLSAFLYGASRVDCFDSNMLTYYNLMLKAYCVKNLDYEDFLAFFGLAYYNWNMKNFYDGFKENIDNNNIRVFFDLLFDNYISINNIYNNNETCYPENLVSSIPYLNEEKYYKLKESIDISRINFVLCDLFDIYKHYNNKYDFINFSNICDYVDNLISFYGFIDDTRSNHLNDNGGIIVNYAWSRPYYDKINTTIAKRVSGYQKGIKTSGYNDDCDSIIYIKKTR